MFWDKKATVMVYKLIIRILMDSLLHTEDTGASFNIVNQGMHEL